MSISTIAIDSQPLLPWNEDTELTLTSVATAGNISVTIPAGQWSRYGAMYQEARPSGGVFTQADYTITLQSSALAGISPKPKDTADWQGLTAPVVVLSVVESRLLKFWKLKVRDLVLAYDLRDSVTIQRPTVSATADGLRSVTYANLHSNLAGRLQPEGWEQQPDNDGQLVRRARYTLYLGSPVELRAGDIAVVSGVKYEVEGQSTISPLDTLTTLSCTRTT